jgi:rSAM/selenodomain-associated transferase 1
LHPVRRLILYTKPAIPGRVKTRLVGELSPAETAALHAAFLDDVAERLLRAEAGGELELWSAWALEEGEALPAGPGRPIRQEGPGLGERLFRGLSMAAREPMERGGAEAVAALGSDHPTVRPETVRGAFDRLAAGADAVLGPSRDGGYYLIGLRPEAVRPELFAAVPWSSERVLEETLARADTLGLAVELLEPGSDVDTPDDLRRLARELAGDPATAALCPRTRDLLAAWGVM